MTLREAADNLAYAAEAVVLYADSNNVQLLADALADYRAACDHGADPSKMVWTHVGDGEDHAKHGEWLVKTTRTLPGVEFWAVEFSNWTTMHRYCNGFKTARAAKAWTERNFVGYLAWLEGAK